MIMAGDSCPFTGPRYRTGLRLQPMLAMSFSASIHKPCTHAFSTADMDGKPVWPQPLHIQYTYGPGYFPPRLVAPGVFFREDGFKTDQYRTTFLRVPTVLYNKRSTTDHCLIGAPDGPSNWGLTMSRNTRWNLHLRQLPTLVQRNCSVLYTPPSCGSDLTELIIKRCRCLIHSTPVHWSPKYQNTIKCDIDFQSLHTQSQCCFWLFLAHQLGEFPYRIFSF